MIAIVLYDKWNHHLTWPGKILVTFLYLVLVLVVVVVVRALFLVVMDSAGYYWTQGRLRAEREATAEKKAEPDAD